MNDDSFFSINRLVEFGMSLAIAQQMVQTMNKTITKMQVPGAMNPIQQAPTHFYYAIIEEKQVGPFSESELSRLISEKKIVKETYVWKPGMLNWEIVEKMPDILRLVALTPPPFNS